MPPSSNLLSLLGRIGLSAIFIIFGLQKIAGWNATEHYMATAGISTVLLPLVLLVEIGGGLAVLSGLFARWVALALAGYSLLTAALFHANLADHAQAVNFWKNAAIAGGFLMLASSGAGKYSLDHLRHGRQ